MRKQLVPVLLTLAEQQLINVLNQIGPSSWSGPVESNGTDLTADRDALKSKIQKHLIQEQEGHCAYCTTDLSTTATEVDHLAKKRPYHRLTWHVENLLCACTSCNTRKKANANFTLVSGNPTRSQITNPRTLGYLIVHPIIDDPNVHIKWCPDRLFCRGYHSPQGQFTIDRFDLKSPGLTESRVANFQRRQIGPLNEQEVQEIIKLRRSLRK